MYIYASQAPCFSVLLLARHRAATSSQLPATCFAKIQRGVCPAKKAPKILLTNFGLILQPTGNTYIMHDFLNQRSISHIQTNCANDTRKRK